MNNSPSTIDLFRHLDAVESGILRLHERLLQDAKEISTPEVQRLVAAIRTDERELLEVCLNHVDLLDPELSLNHDRVNNERTLNLHEQLAIAAQFNCRERVLLLHRLQREICEQLESRGIRLSQG